MMRARSREATSNQPHHRRQGARTRSPLCRLDVATVSLATVLYGGALAGPTTPSRQSAGRAASQDGLTLSQEEGQMDRCLHATGTGLGQDAGPIREPRGGAPT